MEFKIMIGVFLGLGLFALCSIGFKASRDATDSQEERSGLTIYTDYGTGVQYVGTILGGLTPRLDSEGKPIVAKEQPNITLEE